MVVGDGAPALAELLERLLPQLAATDPATMRDDGSRAAAKRGYKQVSVIGFQKHFRSPLSV